jgi:WD40 repeat protein
MQASQVIRRVQFAGDLVAFAMTDGKVSLVRISTGDILDKFSGHKSDISSLYFDGVHLMSGGGDGILNIYNVTYDNSKELGTLIKQHHMHAGMLTGIKVLRSVVDGLEVCTAVTCGADRKLIGFNLETYALLYTL